MTTQPEDVQVSSPETDNRTLSAAPIAAGVSTANPSAVPGVGGEIREVLDYWISGGPANGSPQSTTVGVTGQLESVPLNRNNKQIVIRVT